MVRAPEEIANEFCNSPLLRDYETYIEARTNAMDARKDVSNERLFEIQESVRVWFEDKALSPTGLEYGEFGTDRFEEKFLGLIDFIQTNYPNEITLEEIDASKRFVEMALANYYHPERITPEGDYFSFIVPMRNSRNRTDYSEEVEGITPILRYAPPDLRASIIVGIPPIVLDYYIDENGQPVGFLVLAPIFEDMAEDIIRDHGKNEKAGTLIIDTFKAAINEAADFSDYKLGAKLMGLGATLPRYTNFGQLLKKDGRIPTTGHGGTIEIVGLTQRKAFEEFGDMLPESASDNVGLLGLGAIGFSMGLITAENHPNSTFYLYDKRPERSEKLKQAILDLGTVSVEQVIIAESEKDLMEKSGVIISAVQNGMPFTEEQLPEDMSGKLVIDDSQPGAFIPKMVFDRGGIITWPLAVSTNGFPTRRSYNFSSFADDKTLFGCETEVGTLRELAKKYGKDPSAYAINSPVTVESSKRIGESMKLFGVEASRLQIDGKFVYEWLKNTTLE